MKSTRDNRIVLDIHKCQWARFYYRNQYGDTRNTLPASFTFTVHNETFNSQDEAGFHPDFDDKNLYFRALRLGIIDIWIPEIFFKVTANAGVIFTGIKALSMSDLWNSKIFGKNKTKAT